MITSTTCSNPPNYVIITSPLHHRTYCIVAWSRWSQEGGPLQLHVVTHPITSSLHHHYITAPIVSLLGVGGARRVTSTTCSDPPNYIIITSSLHHRTYCIVAWRRWSQEGGPLQLHVVTHPITSSLHHHYITAPIVSLLDVGGARREGHFNYM